MNDFPVNPLPRVRWNSEDERLASVARAAPRLPWHEFIGAMFDPIPGEHCAILGPTGQGKTVLQNAILPHYPFTVVFATKPVSRSLDALVTNHGYTKVDQWPTFPNPMSNPIDFPRRLLWPDAREIDAPELQHKVFKDAMSRIFREGGRPKDNPVGWAIGIDELWYYTQILKLGKQVQVILLQGRELGVSLIAATQRPAFVPLEIYDQSTHLFFFRDNDHNNLERVSRINVLNRALIKNIVMNLDMHQVLYVNTRTGKMARTHAPAPKER